MNTRQLLLAWFFACLLPLAAQADVWQDPETKVNYGYEPGSGVAQVLRSGDVEGEVFILPRITIDGMEYVVKTNERYAFSGNGALRSISIPGTIGYVQFYTFQDCSSLSSAQLGEGTYGIGDYCFYRTQSLKSIVLPSSLSNISYHAFSESALDSITIPDGITWFGRYNFKNCRNLKKVVLPAVSTFQTDWGGHGYCRNFENCTALEEVVCRSSVPPIILENPFAGVDLNKVMLYVPKGTKEQYLLASIWNEFKDIVEMDIDTGPKLLNTTPRNEDTNIPTSGTILLTFDETVKLREKTIGKLNDIELVPIVSDNTIVFEYSGLDWKKKYTFILPHDCIMDLAGNIVVKDINLSFTTTDHLANAILPYGQFSKRPWFAKNTKNPTEDWYQYGLNDSEWETIVGPINNGSVEYWNTKFPLHAKLYLRRHFHLTEIDTTKNYMLLMGHDLDCKAWVNGTMVLDEKFAHYGWDYSTVLLDKSILKQGDNVLAVYVRDDNPPAFIDCGLYTDAEVAAEEKGELVIDLSPKRIEENANLPVKLKITRTGSWVQEETFLLTATADSRVTVPTTITIPARQSAAVINLPIKNNDVLDADSIVEITAMGESYETVKAQLVIEDDDYPALIVKSSKSTVSEGETFQLTITTSRVSANPIPVTLNCENARRFDFPAQVIIPVGEASVTVDVNAVDNDEIELEESIAFYASADRHERGECIVILVDNDMPTLTFTLSPEAVSEADGYVALFGVIKRTDNLDKRVTLKLSDDSNGLLTYTNHTIIMAKGQAEVQFNIGVTDNDLVDGNRVVNVTAVVYASSCNCSVSGDNKGSMTATVTIIDDDGPTLKIKPAGTAMLEGSEGNVFAISHNMQSEADVIVRISSDKDDMLEYDHELTIPAGQSTANLHVNVKSNDLQDDSSIAAFKVEANGYIMGTCWILITDRTLPDATISLTADKNEAEAEGAVQLRAVIKNVGNASLSSTTPVEISFSGRMDKVKLTIGKTLAVGDSAVIEYNYELPAITGNHTFEATVNATGKVPELIYANNSSEKVGISIISPFSLTAQVDKDIYQQCDSIHVSGVATGNAEKNAKVEVYFINEGARQSVSATTDEEGNYTVGWKPLSKQSGHFIVGACYPGAKETKEMDAFDVYGIRAKDNFKTCELSQTDTQTGKIVITNPGNLAQTGLAVTPKAESNNCVFTYDVPSSIGAGESVEIAYTVTGNEISEGRDWQQMPLEITTVEGSHIDYTIYYYVHSLKARLQTDQSYINTTMTYGTPREYPVTIKNVGHAETGKITLVLPNWIQNVTPSEMASLAQGDSATIVLRFIPTEAMKLNVRVSGQIGINCDNGDGTAVSFFLTPVSEAMGKLKVDVIDEFTYFTDEAPHVSNAKVQVKNPSTNEVVAEGETANDGIFTAEIPEGYYYVTINADKHESYANTVIVDPGVEKSEEVFLSYQAITYSWEVEETEIEDEYEIETIVKYETRVPKPVVIITLPDEQPEPNSIIPVIVTNKGLVNALDFNLDITVSEDYQLEFLNSYTLDELAPQQSFVFYSKLVSVNNEEANARVVKSKKTSKCLYIRAIGSYKEPCSKYNGTEFTRIEKYWGNCNFNDTNQGNLGNLGNNSSGSGKPGSPSGGGSGSLLGGYYYIDYVSTPTIICDEKKEKDSGEGDNIISLPIVGDGPVPSPSPCDNEIKLVYKLVPISGSRYEMKGVAADGVSQVKIVLDPKESRLLPTKDCDGNIIEWAYRWYLSENIGKLDNKESLEDVIYTAPKDYPLDYGCSYPIKAILSCETVSGRYMSFKVEVPIIIVRVPLALIHGLNSNSSCWKKFYDHLIGSGLYDEWQVKRVDYWWTHNSHFSVNYRVVPNAINELKELSYKRNGYVAEKVDLVGHSMGGILSRFHVQQDQKQDDVHKRDDVHKLITVNTPHSGSELGDIATIDPKFAEAAKALFILKDFNASGLLPANSSTMLDAVKDLAVNSKAIDEDLNEGYRSKGYKVPVYAITTTSLLGTIAGNGVSLLLWKLICMYNHTAEYALYLGDSDAIVSRESQSGRCDAICHFDGLTHTSSPDDVNVWNKLTSLLCASTESFSNKWFNPVDRKFTPIIISNFAKRKIKNNPINQNIDINSIIQEDSLIVTVDKDNLFKEHLICASFGDDNLQASDTISLKCQIPSTFVGDIKIIAICKSDDGNIYIDSAFVNVPKPRTQLISVQSDQVIIMTNDSIGVSIQGIWADGSETTIVPDMVEPDIKLAKYINGKLVGIKTGIGSITLGYQGLTCSVPLIVYRLSDNTDEELDVSPSICSTVTLSFKQKNVITRQAFRGTLTVNNGNETTAMKDLKMYLEVRDMDGNLTTSHEFQIDAESLNGFEGNLDFTSGWTLGGGETGVATILFIPTKYAAQTEPKDYSFGGSFSYTDPYTGLIVTRDLNPVTLTVNPSPDLELTYLMQRDVYGDDPLTTDKVEPMEEAEFALIINNKGYGEAKNVRMLTEQPKITENEKELFVNFDIISSQVNGDSATLYLGQTIANDFGTIAARSQAYAQWWLRSTLLGHFTSYEVEANHVTSYGNQDLSLVDTVTIHEMVHGFTPKSNMKRGWLVNDIADADDMPDVVYFTDATQQPLYMATGTTGRKSETEYQLTMTSKTAGWNYGSVADPTNGKQKLVKIVRQSDGAEMPVDNVWQTDRTLRDSRDWLYENRLHFVGDMGSGGETYILTFEPKPEVELAVERFIGVPPEETVLTEPLNEMTVRFTKAIQPETFTADDITLHCQGERQDEKTIIITKQSNTDYLLRLDRVNQQDGYYVLTVQTAGITDSEGFNGRAGKSVSWVQYLKTEMPETYFYVTTTPAGYATFYDSQLAYKLPADLKANVVSGASSEKLTYTKLNDDVVPKGVPVMLESNPHKADTYKLTSTESAAAYNGTNLLRGSDIPTMATPDSGEQIYKLSYGPSGTKWSKVFGWYWGAENGGAFQIEGHKAWLAVPVTSGSRMTGYFVDGDALDVEAVMQNQDGHTDIYDLQGRKIGNRQLPKGVYIWNRQKVIVK